MIEFNYILSVTWLSHKRVHSNSNNVLNTRESVMQLRYHIVNCQHVQKQAYIH